MDTRLHKLDGFVSRRLRGEVISSCKNAAFEVDLKALDEELKQAAARKNAR
ncbi:hypothetical protein [Bradyrhizobium liaoningense]|uniref:hypothetical protein n=1 Tax=Bradyrhizobium liaoningense TaxID=43992 RepID=UPI001BAA4E93|nr:hypothetical protein [Bradyrhizobium liaoningense]MBR1165487.1 hypothetical protein [Bradyrhizobium liaoningense]